MLSNARIDLLIKRSFLVFLFVLNLTMVTSKRVNCPGRKCSSTNAYEMGEVYTTCQEDVKCKEHGVVQGKCGQSIQLRNVIQCNDCRGFFNQNDLKEIKCKKKHTSSNECAMPACNFGY
ncbi:hypothetical protein Pst134EA_000727 [Puccinia striiformis f. sp. tritici]|uniref:hypothetical protein n=1 Tax=Puccinia striiformis f. sp. tritici TaxID=168172 RepID=UPI002007662C|nr:hypothetical protein Pst134EA_000727 [Puccinia striiformis f. sp. tritici]KAH9473647.1 hypothetical protein Pst134EA_000727 [Puccinia striiformis f. sp. tritici]KAI9601795.1 hypothetical protein KEM48_001081 [Puccinia striiformis f. sp. tritici PST-130]